MHYAFVEQAEVRDLSEMAVFFANTKQDRGTKFFKNSYINHYCCSVLDACSWVLGIIYTWNCTSSKPGIRSKWTIYVGKHPEIYQMFFMFHKDIFKVIMLVKISCSFFWYRLVCI